MLDAYFAEIAAWRAEKETALRAEYSWLSLAGLFWLKEGENRFGSAPGNDIVLPQGSAPAQAGVFLVEGKIVTLGILPKAEARLDDEPAPNGAALRPDVTGDPNFLYLGRLRMVLVERGGQLAIRLWDPQHPNRLNFGGRMWYAPDPAYRVSARVKPYDPPKPVTIPDMLGNDNESYMHASLGMEVGGAPVTLNAEKLDSGAYYIMFRDATAGKTTYPAVRYLTTEVAEGDSVIVDFNKALSPPCAFTEFATCPLPPPGNVLKVAIEAGELYENGIR
ncbi:MAG: DUF1684 domain-containing protein [Chloroflexi bacterium]|nr:DUF1684 domain-containing protein [Chloroflexota bacterium]